MQQGTKKNLLLLAICILLKDMILAYQARQLITNWLIVTDLILVFLLNYIFEHVKNGKKAALVYITITCIYAFVQTCYYSVFRVPLRLNQISIIKELFAVKDVANSTLKPIYILYFLPILIAKRLNYQYKGKPRLSKLVVYGGVLIMLCDVLSISYDEYWSVLGGTHEVFYVDMRSTLKSTIKAQRKTDEELEQFNKKYSVQKDNQYTGLLKDKNVIMILCESLDDYGIDEQLTPNIIKLINNGLYFKNYNAKTWPYHTSDTEYLTMTGQIPSLNDGMTFYSYYKNDFPSAWPNLLKEYGYTSKSYHGFKPNYYNRNAIHKKFGFEESLFHEVENMNEIRDDVLFKEIDFAEQGKYFKFIITLSGHSPYLLLRADLVNEIDEVKRIEKFKNLDDETIAYLATCKVLDKAIGIMLNQLEKANKLDDTVIVLYGDHTPYALLTDEARDRILTDYEVPLVISNPSLKSAQIEKECAIEDVYPTLLNLLGIKTDYYKAGVDILSILPSNNYDPYTLEKDDSEMYSFSQAYLRKNYGKKKSSNH